LTDKYWMAALIPPQGEQFKTAYRLTSIGNVDVYESNYVGSAARTLAPGQSVTETVRLFAGAKRAEVLEQYQKDLGLTHFIDAIDWGVLWFLTR
ncbi:membrane protein insertase YidC, partial [Acinetobacter baumannii]